MCNCPCRNEQLSEPFCWSDSDSALPLCFCQRRHRLFSRPDSVWLSYQRCRAFSDFMAARIPFYSGYRSATACNTQYLDLCWAFREKFWSWYPRSPPEPLLFWIYPPICCSLLIPGSGSESLLPGESGYWYYWLEYSLFVLGWDWNCLPACN